MWNWKLFLPVVRNCYDWSKPFNTKKQSFKMEFKCIFFRKLLFCGLMHSILYVTYTSLIMHLICPPKFGISIVFNFSWDGCNTQEKWKTKVMQKFGGQIRCIKGDVQVASAGKESVLGSLSNSVVERRTSTGSGPFALLGSLFETLG